MAPSPLPARRRPVALALLACAAICALPAAHAGAVPVRAQAGQAVIEGEDTDARVARGADAWTTVAQAGASGSAIASGPDNGTSNGVPIASTTAEARYEVEFDQAGTWHVWVRGLAPNTAGNSLHVGLDGAEPSTAAELNTGTFGSLLWFRSRISGATARVTVPTAGVHTVSVYMREDGFVLDRLLLTTNASYTPSGAGPAASPRGTGGGDTTAPSLTARTPTVGASGVAVGANLTATFDEALAPASVTTSSVTLAPAGGGAPVPAAVSLGSGGTVITLNPTADLAAGTQYTATLSTVIEDVAGNNIPAAINWSFTTAASGPGPGAGAFLPSGGQVVMEAESFSTNTPRGTDSWTATATPAGAVGTAMASGPDNGSGSGTPIPSTSPELTYPVQFPGAGTWHVWVRAWNPDGAGNSVHLGLDGATQAASADLTNNTYGSWVWFRGRTASPTARFTVPGAGVRTVNVWMREDGLVLDRILLTTDAAYTPSGSGPAESARAGGPPPGDTTPPSLTARTPAVGATGVAVGSDVTATFNEALAAASVTTSSVTLAPTGGGAAVPAAVSLGSGGTVITLNPTADLAAGTQYTATLSTAVEDVAGNNIPATINWSFTTAQSTPGDTTPPSVTNRTPAPGATGVAMGADVTATFSEALAPGTVSSGTASVAPAAGGAALPAAVTLGAGGTTITVNPAADLAADTLYEVTLGTGITDVAGNALPTPVTWTFRTLGAPTGEPTTRTRITTGQMLGGGRDRRSFYIATDGGPWGLTYAGGHPRAAGRLMNFRAANAVWEDDARADDDPVANTNEFVSWIPTYRALGVMAVTVSLQGGKPGYEGALSSAFRADGSLKPEWMARTAQVIEAADAQGMVVILTYFYKREDDIFTNDASVRAATRNATDWLIARGYANVIIEIANEYNTTGYHKPIFLPVAGRFPGVAELITIARSRFDGLGWRVPISASTTDMRLRTEINEVSDVALVHGNSLSPEDDGLGVAALVANPEVNGPVLVNEDFNGYAAVEANFEKERASAQAVFDVGGSWGLMFQPYNQNYPFRWAVGPSTVFTGQNEANYFRAILTHMRGLTITDTTAPGIADRGVAPGETGVSTSSSVAVSFTESMDRASLTTSSVRLLRDGFPVAATVAAGESRTVTLTPDAPLDPLTTYVVSLTSAATDTAGNALAPASWSFTTGPAAPLGPSAGDAGTVVIEAEGAASRFARSNRSWLDGQSPAGSVGDAVLAGPDGGLTISTNVATTSPELSFDVHFDRAGSYGVWLRGWAPSASGDSVSVSIDGLAPVNLRAANMNTATYGAWHWFVDGSSLARATLQVATPGRHTVHVYMREDGFSLDRLLLTTDTTLTPTGTGPAASPRP